MDVDGGGARKRKLIELGCSAAPQLLWLTVIQNAVPRPGAPHDWNSPIQAGSDVVVQARTEPNDFATWNQIAWIRGRAVEWASNRRLVSRAALGTTRIVASLGDVAVHVDIHIYANLVRLDVRSAAPLGHGTWRATYDDDQQVEVQVVTDPDTADAWNLVQWDGGTQVLGHPNLRRVPRNVIGEHTVTASLGNEDEANIQIEPELVSLEVEENAALHQSSGQWRTLYAEDLPVLVRAKTRPDLEDAWRRLQWSGGEEVTGALNRRRFPHAQIGAMSVGVTLLDADRQANSTRAHTIHVLPLLVRLDVNGAGKASSAGVWNAFFHPKNLVEVRAYTMPENQNAWALLKWTDGAEHSEPNKRYVSLANVGSVTVSAELPGQEPLSAAVNIRPVKVTPALNPDTVLWFRAGAHAAAVKTVVTLAEEPSAAGAYAGGANLHRNAETIEVFLDESCETPVNFDEEGNGSIEGARDGTELYVRGAGVGGATLTLDLRAVGNHFVPGNAAAQDFEVRAVNLISASIHCDQLVLVHGNDHLRPTDPSRLILAINQTNPSHAPGDLKIRLHHEIACFREQACTTAVASGTELAANAIPETIYMRGLAGGNCDVRAVVVGTAGPGWHFAEEVTQTVLVERLELQVMRCAAGNSTNPDVALVAPKQRELHARSGAIFTLARVTVRAPSNDFWQKADQLLIRHTNLDVFADGGATNPGTDVLAQGDFGAPVHRFIATQGAPAWDFPGAVGPGGHGVPPTRNPASVIAHEYVSCGARIRATAAADGNSTTLRYGDVVRLDTFSFDQYLDRVVGNRCVQQIGGAHGGIVPTDVALAHAAAHRYYGLLSTFWVNLNFYPAGGGPFQAFINSMNIPGNNNTWATAGANFVNNFLQTQHAIFLTGVMYNRIRDHILNVLTGATIILHANQDAQGRFRQYFGFSALYGPPGVHAECLAINELLGLGLGLGAANLTVATYMLQNQAQRQGKRFVACPNCSGILLPPGGPRVITG
jgi:hypothetical protein